MTTTGLYPDMDAITYRADPCPAPSLTQSLIQPLIERSPMHAAFAHPRLNPYGSALESSAAMFLGDAVHRLALGRGREISCIRYPDYTSASAREARNLAVAGGRIPVLERDLIKAQDMAVILREQIAEACEGHPYLTEVVIIWQEQTAHGAIWCRAMLDVLCPSLALVLDPKALRIAAVPGQFGRTAADSGYDLQAVFYARGVGAVMPEMEGRVRFANLVVENTPPHGSAMMEPDAMSRDSAEGDVSLAIETWAKCLSTRCWPGYPRGVSQYTTPAWAQSRSLARMGDARKDNYGS